MWLLPSTNTIDEQFEVYGEKGRKCVGGHTIRDTSPKEWMDLTTVIAKSSNIGIAKIGEQLGRQELYDTYRKLGFGVESKVGLLGDSASYENQRGGLILSSQPSSVKG